MEVALIRVMSGPSPDMVGIMEALPPLHRVGGVRRRASARPPPDSMPTWWPTLPPLNHVAGVRRCASARLPPALMPT